MTARRLIDSNVIIDVLTKDPAHYRWSRSQLEAAISEGLAVINPIILAEVATAFVSQEALDAALPAERLPREPLPFAAAFSVAQAFLKYRRAGGTKHTPMPDFYIGAHAKAHGWTLVTRDLRRYKTYFPELDLIAPTSEQSSPDT